MNDAEAAAFMDSHLKASVAAMGKATAAAAAIRHEAQPRRAYVTLLARGHGSYVNPLFDSRPAIPDYVRTAAPLLCSLRRSSSRYPLVVLAFNLSLADKVSLRRIGASDIVDIGQHEPLATAAPARPLSGMYAKREPSKHSASDERAAAPPQGQPTSCLLTAHASWIVWGRGDMAQTMLKAFMWRELDGRYDELIFLDADVPPHGLEPCCPSRAL